MNDAIPPPLPPAPTPARRPTPTPAPIPFRDALAFWFKLGFISFGGPAGQIAILHAELVEKRRWISEARFLHALNYCMLLPGPEAQQLATYLGWLMHRSLGGILAGALFVLPSLFILIALSYVYLRFGEVPAIAGVFYGIKPAVAALVLHAAYKLGSRTLKTPLLMLLAAAAFVALAVFDIAFPWVVGVAALVGWLGSRWAPQQLNTGAGHALKSGVQKLPALIDDDTPTPPHARFSRARLVRVLLIGIGLWLLGMGALVISLGWQAAYTQMAWFFTKAALLTFGGAYAVLPYVHQGAVETHQWLTAAQMMDGLALGESTPGPLIMVVAFVGFLGGWQQALLGPDALLAAGVLAACLVTWFTFLPSFIFILAGGPLVEATHGRLGFTAPLTAISAAVVGVILSLALYFGQHVLFTASDGFDAIAGLMMAAAAVALIRFQVGVLPLLGVCGLMGMLLR